MTDYRYHLCKAGNTKTSVQKSSSIILDGQWNEFVPPKKIAKTGWIQKIQVIDGRRRREGGHELVFVLSIRQKRRKRSLR